MFRGCLSPIETVFGGYEGLESLAVGRYIEEGLSNEAEGFYPQ